MSKSEPESVAHDTTASAARPLKGRRRSGKGTSDSLDFLAGGGEMGARMRAKDWAKTPLGPVQNWSKSLRTAVSICLNSRFPMVIWWGQELVLLYNDGWRPILGENKDRKALGSRGQEIWSEIWDVLGPMFNQVLTEGKATWSDDGLLLVNRYGFTEEAYFTWSYSPIRDDDGAIGGVFTAVTETTARVIGERRLQTLRDLGEHTFAEARTAEQACLAAANTLARNGFDIPFALIYLLDEKAKQARLIRAVGIDGINQRENFAPTQVVLGQAPDVWNFSEITEGNTAQLRSDFADKFGRVTAGAWKDDPIRQAVVVPLAKAGLQVVPAGFLVCGVSPRIAFDQNYGSFLELASRHIATAIANARSLEEERKRAEALAELDRAKTTFFSNISHELRTPLTLIIGPTEDAISSHRPLSSLELEMVHRNEKRLLKLVNTLLDFTRIEARRAQASFEPVDLAQLTSEIASVFRSAMERAGLSFTIVCSPLSQPVYVDRDMWEKIVLNLVSNAFKSTFQGTVKIEITEENGKAQLSVRDTGTGIPKHELEHLFERFHRVQGAKRRSHEGTGIGLALVQELVKMHGGTITAQSEVGIGTTFNVSIPFGSTHLPAEHLSHGSGRRIATASSSTYLTEALSWLPSESSSSELAESIVDFDSVAPATDGKVAGRVLVADDNRDMREYVQRLLSPQFEVFAVENGRAALDHALSGQADVVLSDVMMPEMDGFELLRSLRQNASTKTIPVILLSARAGEEAQVEGLEHGADDYLVKPFSARELIARVSAHVTLSRMRRESEQAIRMLNEQLAAEVAAMSRMQQISARLIQADEFALLLDEILDAAITVTHADKGNIQLFQGDCLVIAAQRGFDAPFLDHFRTVQRGHAAACGTALQNGERVVVEDVTTSPIFAGTTSLDVLLAANVRAVQSTPLVGRSGQMLGMFSTHWHAPHRPSEQELRALDVLARQAADLIERKQAERALVDSEQRMRLFIENAPAAIAMFDRDMRYMAASRRWLQDYGLTCDVVGQSHYHLFPEIPERWKEAHRRGLRGEVLRADQDVFLRADGSEQWIKWEIHPWHTSTGVLGGIMIAAEDITARVKSEEALRRSEKLAAVGRLAATMAHEINNPLESVTNLLFLLKKEPGLSEQARANLRIADQELDRVAHIAKQTLGFYRDSSAPKLMNPAEAIKELLAVYSYRFRNRDIRVEKELDGSAAAFAAPGEFRQVFSNLFVNAVDAISEDKGRIRVRVREARDWRNGMQPGVCITIADNGHGISPEHLNRIFDPFYTTKEEVGTGLGLWLSQSIVQKHNGRIRVRSSVRPERSGTVFTVFWPSTPRPVTATSQIA